MSIGIFNPAAPFIDSLPRPARAAFSFLRPLALSGLSMAAIHRHLVSAGIEIGLGSVRAAVKAINMEYQSKPYLDRLGRDRLPNPDRLQVSKSKILRRYSYNIVVTGVHAQTGEVISQYVTVSTHDLITKNRAIDMAKALLLADPSKYPINITHASVENILKSSTIA